MQSKKIRFLTMTAVLLALTVAFQLLNKTALGATPASPYIIGTLVNLCLILAAVVVGVCGAARPLRCFRRCWPLPSAS